MRVGRSGASRGKQGCAAAHHDERVDARASCGRQLECGRGPCSGAPACASARDVLELKRVAMGGSFAACFGCGTGGVSGDRPAVTPTGRTCGGARPSPSVRGKDVAPVTADASAGGVSAPPPRPPSVPVHVRDSPTEDVSTVASPSSAIVSPPSSADIPATGCTSGGRTQPSAVVGRTGDSDGAAGSDSNSGSPALVLTGGGDGGSGFEGRTGRGDAGVQGTSNDAPERGFPLVTFRAWPRASDARKVCGTRKVDPGMEVHASLGRNLYLLWRTSRRPTGTEPQ